MTTVAFSSLIAKLQKPQARDKHLRVIHQKSLFKNGLFKVLLGVGGALLLTAGCGSNSGSSGGNASTQELVLLSPHSSDIQVEFENAFKAKNPDVKLKWLDQGGSSSVSAFVIERYKNLEPGKGIGVDVLFGGGAETYVDIQTVNALQSLDSDYSVPETLNGVPLRGKNNEWVAAALSGFGILANKALIDRDKLPMPQTWADLGNPKLQGRIALADPRQSGSAHMAYEIILQANGWQKGWEVLTAMAGNARGFGKSSSALLDDVAGGEAVVAPAIDFYARSKAATADGKLVYIEPKGQRVITADPIAILKGAPNEELAKKFVAFVLSPEGQKLWIYPKGGKGGPKNHNLYRQAALPIAYKGLPADAPVKANPYEGKNDFVFDSEKAALRRRALDDLIGAVLIDNLSDVQARWKKTPVATQITFVPVSEDDLSKLAEKWNDNSFRNKTIGEWKEAVRVHFGS